MGWGTRKCPFCAEEIKSAAIVCKHCKRDLSPKASVLSQSLPAAPPRKGTSKLSRNTVLTVIGIVVVLYAIGQNADGPPPSGASTGGSAGQISAPYTPGAAFNSAPFSAPKPSSAAQSSAATPSNETCREDLQCWGDKNSLSASFECDDHVERLAKYSFRWTDGWLEPKFSRFRWKNKARGQITYIGDRIEFQNGFGAFQSYTYTCDYDPDTQTVLNVDALPGRLPK